MIILTYNYYLCVSAPGPIFIHSDPLGLYFEDLQSPLEWPLRVRDGWFLVFKWTFYVRRHVDMDIGYLALGVCTTVLRLDFDMSCRDMSIRSHLSL